MLGFGGQTGLNLGVALEEQGILRKYGIKVRAVLAVVVDGGWWRVVWWWWYVGLRCIIIWAA